MLRIASLPAPENWRAGQIHKVNGVNGTTINAINLCKFGNLLI
jgi:hypothetical protein